MIEIEQISKTFHVHQKAPGLWNSLRSLFKREWIEKIALSDVSLTVSAGEILGVVGANGAGKTTLVKILSGIIHPTSGTARVLGFHPWERHNEFRRQIGLLMGQKAQLWWDLTAGDCFLLLREIYQIPPAEYRATLDELAALLDVQQLLNTQIRRLSLGERMKMELIATLLHRPKVVFLDEPTIGLDISAQRAVRKFILEYSARHRPAIILTSHYMQDIEELCERIVIVREGRFVYDGSLREVITRYATHKLVTVELEEQASAPQSLPEGTTIIPSEPGFFRARATLAAVPGVISAIMEQCAVRDISIEEEDISNIIEALMTSHSTTTDATCTAIAQGSGSNAA